MNKIIYLDSAARTIPYHEVLDIFTQYNGEFFANPSSIHFEGAKASRILDKSKEEVLKALHLKNHNVVFIDNATEGNNLAIKGFALKYKNRGNHIITSEFEHPSVIETCKQLEKEFGFEVSYLKPNESGVITVDNVLEHIKPNTILVSIMAVNNEIGTVNPIREIANALKKFPKLVFHVDACQAIGKVNIDYNDVSLLTISSHKIHGLVSGGALVVRKNLELLPLFSGGGQEYGYRSGTVDLSSAVAFTYALKKSINDLSAHLNIVKPLSELLISYLKSKPDVYEINSGDENPYIVNFSTKTKKGSVVVEALSQKGIMVSSTSACSSYKEKGSYVVKSLSKPEQISNNTVRVSFSFLNTIEEIQTLINELDKVIGEIR